MAVFVSSALALTITVPFGVASLVLALLVEGVGAVVVVTVFFTPVQVPNGDICFRLLWAAITILEGFLNKLGLRRLWGGDGTSSSLSSFE